MRFKNEYEKYISKETYQEEYNKRIYKQYLWSWISSATTKLKSMINWANEEHMQDVMELIKIVHIFHVDHLIMNAV